MNSILVIVLMTFSLAGCFNALNVTSGKISSEAAIQSAGTYAVASSGQDDKASALIQPSATETQVIQAPTQGTLAGLSINVSPGTLGSPTSLVIEAGVSLSETSVVSETALAGDIRIESASQGIVIRPTEAAELRNPLKISLPLPALSSLQLIERNYAVYFKYLEPETGRLLTGLLAPDGVNTFVRYDEVSQRDVIQFNGYFGSYWVVQLSRAPTVAEVPMIKETKEAIVNKSQVSVIDIGGVVKESAIVVSQAIPSVVLQGATLTTDLLTRELTLSVAFNKEIKTCVADIYEHSSDLKGASYNVGGLFSFTGKIEKASAHTLVGRFRCIDINGKSVLTSWTSPLDIPEIPSVKPSVEVPAATPVPTFVSTWNIEDDGSSDSMSISLPLSPTGTYNCIVDWGDGTVGNIASYSLSASKHIYSSPGVYTVKISGTLIGWSFAYSSDALKIVNISAWGPLGLGNEGNYFGGAANLTISATDRLSLIGTTNLSGMFSGCSSLANVPGIEAWDMSAVADLSLMFYGATSFNQSLANWNTSAVTNMSRMFFNATTFNQSISSWNVGSVQNMYGMFFGATHYNQDMNSWDVSQVLDMGWMFYRAISFNQSLNNWNVGSVKDMTYMFRDAIVFNQPLNNWDVSSVLGMSAMFCNAHLFNQALNDWDVSSVRNMSQMFRNASVFNQPLNNWATNAVENMGNVFEGAYAFNQPLNNWNVSSVTSMSGMFAGGVFNQSLNNWDVSNVRSMAYMFRDASSFNGNISAWNVGLVESMYGMFYQAQSFNQNISSWDVDHVTDMSYMFSGTYIFNQDLSVWNVSAVTDMAGMFENAQAFNSNIGSWNTSSVTNMNGLFRNSPTFNQPLNNWNVSSVASMRDMFLGASSFNQPLNNWNVSMVTDVESMFAQAYSFNGDVSSWNVGNVTEMSRMFRNASTFNQNLSAWDVGSVTNMTAMFEYADAFNGSLAGWDVSRVTSMAYMFRDAISFNSDLGGWNVGLVSDMNSMFKGANSFNRDLSNWNVRAVSNMTSMFSDVTLSQYNYDALLIGWSGLPLQPNVNFHGGLSRYSSGAAAAARASIIANHTWIIEDDGLAP